MTDSVKISMVESLSNETDEDVISAFLTFAGETLCSTFIPDGTDDEKETFLNTYGSVQVKAAAYYINKRGWDFQTSHHENGVIRQFEAGDLPDSILRLIPPKAVVIS